MKYIDGNFRENYNNFVQIEIILYKGEKFDDGEFFEEEGGSNDDDDDKAGESKQQILKKIEKARKAGNIAAGKGADDEDNYDGMKDFDYKYNAVDL